MILHWALINCFHQFVCVTLAHFQGHGRVGSYNGQVYFPCRMRAVRAFAVLVEKGTGIVGVGGLRGVGGGCWVACNTIPHVRGRSYYTHNNKTRLRKHDNNVQHVEFLCVCYALLAIYDLQMGRCLAAKAFFFSHEPSPCPFRTVAVPGWFMTVPFSWQQLAFFFFFLNDAENKRPKTTDI